jgi:anion-transporting  ArsA/GET3 family ATPase
MQDFKYHRVILLTGKGGVGKTTLTAALGRAMAKSGRRVLVSEPAYSETDELPLARQLGLKGNPKGIHSVQENFAYTGLRARIGHETFLRTVIPSPRLIRAALKSKAVARFLIAAPSLHEMGLFYHLLTLLNQTDADGGRAFDSIIVDMPATGHALALTQLPDILLRLIPSGPIARALLQGQAILNDPAQGAAWIVSLPQQLPVSESLELIAGLEETRMYCAGVLLNMMPRERFSEPEVEQLRGWCETHDWIGENVLVRGLDADASEARLKSAIQRPVIRVPHVSDITEIDAVIEAMVGTE